MKRTVAIRCFPEGTDRASSTSHALVAVDVIRATTTAVTAVAMGRRCYPVASVDEALEVAARLPDALLVGELGGTKPQPFHLTNSPAKLASRDDRRPVVLLSSSGTQLMRTIRHSDAAYVACFRNTHATARHLAQCDSSVTVIGAGNQGEFREEDQMCCAWLASALFAEGLSPEDQETADLARRWQFASPYDLTVSRSVAYLRRTRQLRDLAFILKHVGDVDCAFRIAGDEIVRVQAASAPHPRVASSEGAPN